MASFISGIKKKLHLHVRGLKPTMQRIKDGLASRTASDKPPYCGEHGRAR